MNNSTNKVKNTAYNETERFIPDDDFVRTWTEIYNNTGNTRNTQANTVSAEPDTMRDVSTLSSPADIGEKNPIQTETSRKKQQAIRRYKGLIRLAAGALILTMLYSIAVYSNIPFIEKWRTIYIETAMGTMSHHWLATLFIPKSVIDEVVYNTRNLDDSQAGLSSNWNLNEYSDDELYQPWKKGKSKLSKIYNEIDLDSFADYIKNHPDEIINENGYLVIDKAGLKDESTSIKTIYGDEVLAIDTENAITIVKVTGEGYVGRLAIIKDPSRVGLGLSKGYDQRGSSVENLAKHNDAVLAINASGFYDPEGKGNGGNPYGLVISNGKVYQKSVGLNYKTIALDKNDKLNIGEYESVSAFRDAVEFKPALIIDGEIRVTGSAGWGIQPRSAIGQTKNGEILLLIVDGRAPGYSIGSTVGELAQIMSRYGAYQACNLDGGSSSIMYYNGRIISKPSAANKVDGRAVPNGFVVYNRTNK